MDEKTLLEIYGPIPEEQKADWLKTYWNARREMETLSINLNMDSVLLMLCAFSKAHNLPGTSAEFRGGMAVAARSLLSTFPEQYDMLRRVAEGQFNFRLKRVEPNPARKTEFRDAESGEELDVTEEMLKAMAETMREDATPSHCQVCHYDKLETVPFLDPDGEKSELRICVDCALEDARKHLKKS